MKDDRKTKAELIEELKKLRRKVTRLEKKGEKPAPRKKLARTDADLKAEKELQTIRAKQYHALFENSPVPLQIWDFSGIRKYLERLARKGVDDFHGYFSEHPADFMECVSLLRIREINARAAELYKAKSKEDLIENARKTFSVECFDCMADSFEAIRQGRLDFRYRPHMALTLRGEEIHVITEYSVMPGYEKTFERVLISQIDVTERTKVEQELLNSQERFRSIMDSLDAIVYVADMDTYEVLYINEYARRAFGDVIGKLCWKSMQSDQRGPCDFCTNRYLLNPDGSPAEPYRWELLNTRTERWYYITDKAIRWSDGRLVRLEIATDITERKRIEEKLIESEESFRSIIETEPECVKMVDSDGRLIMMNPSGLRMIEAESVETIRGQSLLGLIDPEFRAAFRNMLREVFGGKESKLAFRMTGLKGRSLWLDTISAPLRDEHGNVKALLGVTRDITEQKQMEISLRESESILRESQEIGRIGSYILDIQSGRWRSSAVLDGLFGIDESFERTIEGWASLIHPDWRNMIVRYFMRDVIEKRGRFDREYKIVRHSDGAERWVHGMGKLELDDEGSPLRMVGTVQDITERKLAEETLRNSEERFRALVESSSDWVWEIDREGKYTFVSTRVRDMLEYEPDEIMGRSPFDLMPEEEALRVGRIVGKLMEKGDPIIMLENINITKSGRKIILETNGVPFFNEEGELLGYRGVDRDITERKKLEMDMIRMKNLESIGILAGGIAHDFNNLLAGIVGNASLALMRINERDYVSRKLSDVEAVSLLAQKLTRQLLTFSKGGMPVLEPESIDRIIKTSVLFSLSGSNIRSELLINEELWPVEVDEGQISQVFNNLVLNAREAMPGGGIITVTADNIELAEAEVGDLKGGRYVKVSVEDQGSGIPPEDFSRIFDPYFSTKERGAEKGTGLGLAICHSIVHKHSGFISVESGMGKGTVFHVYLPVSDREAEHKQKGGTDELNIESGKKILIMDDDRMIRTVASELLMSFGFEVEAAQDGREAIELYRQARESGEPFDAVILDLTVPGGMGGSEAIMELKEIDPDVKAVIVSGYAENAVVSGYADHGFSAALTKPFNVATLREVMSTILEEGR